MSNRIPICTLVLAFFINTVSAYEEAYPRTEVGQSEIKVLPAATLIASQTQSSYFESNGALFRPLFRYIQSNDIAMTTPVEAEISPGVMYFYIGSDRDYKDLPEGEKIQVLNLPERLVASIGVRGGYNETNFAEAEATLRAWIQTQEAYQIDGDARGVFWNGPMTPGFMKRFEVHLPIRKSLPTEERSSG
ncbi:MAG: heme-binding protein [Verrucomicrobiota bacterium]